MRERLSSSPIGNGLAPASHRGSKMMMRAGAIDEVKALLSLGLSSELPAMRAIGVREIAEVLADRLRPGGGRRAGDDRHPSIRKAADDMVPQPARRRLGKVALSVNLGLVVAECADEVAGTEPCPCPPCCGFGGSSLRIGQHRCCATASLPAPGPMEPMCRWLATGCAR